jgi:hypothetical protein
MADIQLALATNISSMYAHIANEIMVTEITVFQRFDLFDP